MTSGEAACRTAAITGAGGGLGRSVALKLAEKGQRVYGTELVDAEVDETAQVPLCEAPLKARSQFVVRIKGSRSLPNDTEFTANSITIVPC